jgi:hypothetical protein
MRAMLLLVALGLVTSGCASITAGTTQSVMVQTAPATASECTLVNDKGTWHLPQTPGATSINKAYGDLVVTCVGKDGTRGSANVASTTTGAAFGNIIAGGIIGAAVDMSSGAAYVYPSNITVAMHRQTGEPTAPSANAVAATPVAVAPAAGAASAKLSTEEARTRLKQLQELRESGALSDIDYQARVKQVAEQM